MFTVALFSSTAVNAQSQLQDLNGLDEAIENFTGAGVGAPGGAMQPVDRRLRLAPCSNPPLLSWYGINRTAVEIQCQMPGGWKVYAAILKPGGAANQAADMVHRGDVVSLTVFGEGFAIQRAAEALESGGRGDWVGVKLDSKSGVLRAKVLDEREVGIDLP